MFSRFLFAKTNPGNINMSSRQFGNFFGQSQQNGNTSGRFIESMENRHLYMLVGGSVVAWCVVPDLIDSYNNRKIKKERVQMKADIKKLQSDVHELKDDIQTLKK